MEFRNKGFGTVRRLQKSHTQQHLHRKRGKTKKQKLPTLEERKAGGIYGFMAKKHHKPDPLKAQLDLYSNWIEGFNSTPFQRPAMTSRQDMYLAQPEMERLQAVRQDFIKRTLPQRLNPITHKEHLMYKSKHHSPRPHAREVIESPKPKPIEINDVSSEESVERKVLKKNDPDYYNLLYHDSESQMGGTGRYLSEMREIGKDIRHPHQVSKTTQPSPRTTVFNNTFKQKSSVRAVFPIYGVQAAKDPFSTTNQRFDAKKKGEELDYIDRSHFRQVYNMKTYMEEMLKAKNMRGEKK